jgi:hypothetical protein
VPERAVGRRNHQARGLRHAGRADIIREQIDGEAVPRLVLTLAGASSNDFFQPYRPAPGTLLA